MFKLVVLGTCLDHRDPKCLVGTHRPLSGLFVTSSTLLHLTDSVPGCQENKSHCASPEHRMTTPSNRSASSLMRPLPLQLANALLSSLSTIRRRGERVFD